MAYERDNRQWNCNQNAVAVNDNFVGFLIEHSIRPDLVEPFLSNMAGAFDKLNNTNREQLTDMKSSLADVQKKIDKLEEKYFIEEEMSEETYRKLKPKYSEEKAQIVESIEGCGQDCSNYNQYLSNALQFSSKLSAVWASASIPHKERLQNAIFPEGVLYNRKNEAFRTENVGVLFGVIASLNSIPEDNKKGQLNRIIELSNQVGMTGFEPAAPTSRT